MRMYLEITAENYRKDSTSIRNFHVAHGFYSRAITSTGRRNADALRGIGRKQSVCMSSHCLRRQMTKDDCEHCPDSALEALLLKIEKLENQIRDIQFDIKCLEERIYGNTDERDE